MMRGLAIAWIAVTGCSPTVVGGDGAGEGGAGAASGSGAMGGIGAGAPACETSYPCFEPAQVYEVDGLPWGLAAADVDGDGVLDLVVANQTSPSVSVLFGVGDGTFEPQLSVPMHGVPGVRDGPKWIALEDIDGDGDLDIVAPSHALGGAGFVRNLGGRTFGAAETFGPSHIPYAGAVVDVTGDGVLDVVSAGTIDNLVGALFVMAGDGAGTFGPPQSLDVLPYLIETVATGDVDGDGRLDVLASGTTEWLADLFLGQADGTLAQGQAVYTDKLPRDVELADVTSDGVLDWVGSVSQPNGVLVGVGRGDGTFYEPTWTPLEGFATRGLDVADVDGDGHLDVLVGGGPEGVVWLLVGVGDGTFKPPVGLAMVPESAVPLVVDLNGDGHMDVVCTGSDDQVGVLVATGG